MGLKEFHQENESNVDVVYVDEYEIETFRAKPRDTLKQDIEGLSQIDQTNKDESMLSTFKAEATNYESPNLFG